MQNITGSFSLNRDMSQVTRDITPPLLSLQSTFSMMESASFKSSGKQSENISCFQNTLYGVFKTIITCGCTFSMYIYLMTVCQETSV